MTVSSVTKFGGEMKLSYNSADWASPTWVAGDIVMDNDHDESADAVPAFTRGGFPFKEYLPGMTDLGEEFEVMYKTGTTDTVFLAFQNAKRNRTPIDVSVSDGLMETGGVNYVRFLAEVTDWKRGEAVGDVVKCKIKLVPSANNGGHHPVYGTVPVS